MLKVICVVGIIKTVFLNCIPQFANPCNLKFLYPNKNLLTVNVDTIETTFPNL